MPIENFRLSEPVKEKVQKRISSLIDDGIIAGVEQDNKNYQFFFWMAIQFVPKYSKQRFSFGKPEGIRVFINVNRKVVAAVDFTFNKKVVKFSHIYQGPPLAQLVKIIKKLHLVYAKSKVNAHVELIQFFYIRSQFVLVKTERAKIFYRNSGSKLTRVTLSEMKNEIETILKDPPKFEKH